MAAVDGTQVVAQSVHIHLMETKNSVLPSFYSRISSKSSQISS